MVVVALRHPGDRDGRADAIASVRQAARRRDRVRRPVARRLRTPPVPPQRSPRPTGCSARWRSSRREARRSSAALVARRRRLDARAGRGADGADAAAPVPRRQRAGQADLSKPADQAARPGAVPRRRADAAAADGPRPDPASVATARVAPRRGGACGTAGRARRGCPAGHAAAAATASETPAAATDRAPAAPTASDTPQPADSRPPTAVTAPPSLAAPPMRLPRRPALTSRSTRRPEPLADSSRAAGADGIARRPEGRRRARPRLRRLPARLLPDRLRHSRSSAPKRAIRRRRR